MKRLLQDISYRKSILYTSVLTGLLLGGTFSLGWYLEKEGNIDFSSGKVYLLWMLSSLLISALVVVVFLALDGYSNKIPKCFLNFNGSFKQWLKLYFVLVGCYTVTFLAVFPGFFAYDATMAHLQYYYNIISTQHPWIHTLILGYIVEFSKSHLGHANVGIAIFIYAQMLFVSGCFTYVLSVIKKRIHSDVLFLLFFLYYALFPTIHMFALCSTKDTIFSAIMLVVLVLLLEMTEDIDAFLKHKLKTAVFVGFMFAILMLRKNALYAVLVFIPLFLLFLKRNWWKGGLVIGCSLLMYLIYAGPITDMAGIVDIGPKEALSVPSQQLARVYNLNKDILSVDEIEEIEMFYPKEFLEMYLPKLADYTKGTLNTEYFLDHVKEYFELWATVGLKAPDVYVNSFLINNYGFWYPWATLDGYKGFAGMEGTVLEDAEVFYFAYVTETPGERWSLIPVLDKLMYWFSTTNLHEKLPILSLLFSPGFMFWIFVVTVAYSIHKKRTEVMPMLLIMALVWLTVLLGPIALVRYVLFLFFGFPLLGGLLFGKETVLDENR